MPPKEHSDVKFMVLDLESGKWSEVQEVTLVEPWTELVDDCLSEIKDFNLTFTMSLISNNERRRRGMKPFRWRTLNKWRNRRQQS